MYSSQHTAHHTTVTTSKHSSLHLDHNRTQLGYVSAELQPQQLEHFEACSRPCCCCCCYTETGLLISHTSVGAPAHSLTHGADQRQKSCRQKCRILGRRRRDARAAVYTAPLLLFGAFQRQGNECAQQRRGCEGGGGEVYTVLGVLAWVIKIARARRQGKCWLPCMWKFMASHDNWSCHRSVRSVSAHYMDPKFEIGIRLEDLFNYCLSTKIFYNLNLSQKLLQKKIHQNYMHIHVDIWGFVDWWKNVLWVIGSKPTRSRIKFFGSVAALMVTSAMLLTGVALVYNIHTNNRSTICTRRLRG